MNSIASVTKGMWRWSLAWAACTLLFVAANVPASNVQTNWVERWVTNTVAVEMQANRFVTEFHTNWIHQVKTNVLDLYVTNHLTRTLTNSLDVYTTNYVTKTLTNNLIVDVVQTNFVRAFRTNLHTLNLTNWNTVLLFKTNWVNQPVTNVVEIEMAKQTPTDSAAKVGVGDTAATGGVDEPLSILASRSARPVVNNVVEVVLSVKWANKPDGPLRVQQWRVEKDDGSILSFGDEREFKRPLPVGVYKIQVRVQRDSRDTFTVGRGTLTITAQEALVAQKPSIKRSST